MNSSYEPAPAGFVSIAWVWKVVCMAFSLLRERG
jgi:hypothetical protein